MQSRVLYHVTLTNQLPSIKQNGIEPRAGQRTIDFGETGDKKAVYLFASLGDVENALYNWMGEWFEDNGMEDVELSILEIKFPHDFPLEHTFNGGGDSWEWYTETTIPAQYITKVIPEEQLSDT